MTQLFTQASWGVTKTCRDVSTRYNWPPARRRRAGGDDTPPGAGLRGTHFCGTTLSAREEAKLAAATAGTSIDATGYVGTWDESAGRLCVTRHGARSPPKMSSRTRLPPDTAAAALKQ